MEMLGRVDSELNDPDNTNEWDDDEEEGSGEFFTHCN